MAEKFHQQNADRHALLKFSDADIRWMRGTLEADIATIHEHFCDQRKLRWLAKNASIARLSAQWRLRMETRGSGFYGRGAVAVKNRQRVRWLVPGSQVRAINCGNQVRQSSPGTTALHSPTKLVARRCSQQMRVLMPCAGQYTHLDFMRTAPESGNSRLPD